MELYERLCKNCGGDLRQTEDGRYKCSFCGSVFESEAVVDYAKAMSEHFDELKIEAISNARKNLYEAVNAEYISSQQVCDCCAELKKLIPDDPQACFYEIATGKNVKQITKAIRNIIIDKNDMDIESIIRFLIRSLQTEFQLELNNLIARAFENTDPVKFEHYCTLLSAEAIKVDTGVYETKLPREVFVAYSSKDMDAVSELVETLEAQGLKCFVAARNLRHGKGAVENYNAAIEEAMDHCRSVVFVSSINSRSFNCDALTIELPYIQKKDLESAPAELRNNYKAIPGQYKKPRVEYRIGESTSVNVADAISNEIFDGYERAYTPEEVAARVMRQLLAAPTKVEAATEPKAEPKKVKYCVSCLSECYENAKFCSVCGGSQFADAVKEAELMQKIAAMEKASQTATPAPAPAPASAPAPTPAPTPKPAPAHNASTGLDFTLNNDGKSYSVSKGTCTDEKIVIPSAYNGKPVTSIGDSAFSGCSSLTSITIPDSVTSIGWGAFKNCSRLAIITIPFVGATKDDKCNTHFGYIFGGKEDPIERKRIGRDEIIILNKHLTSNSNQVVPNSLKKVIITGGTRIKEYAFCNCQSLISVTIPDSIIYIGKEAFWHCSSLNKVIITKPSRWIDEKNNKFFGIFSTPQKNAKKLVKVGSSISIFPTLYYL